MKPWELTRIDRYLARQLTLALVAVTTGLVALGWLMQSLRFVETVANRGLSLGVFLKLSSLGIPGLTATVLPITTFVVVQFIYERITTDRELTVMRAAGLSQFALARPALAVAGITMCFASCSTSGSCPPASPRSGNTSSRCATSWRPSCCRRACSTRCRMT